MELYKIPHEVEFEGILVHDKMVRPAEIENVRDNLHVIDGDVIIAAYPRSGEACSRSHGSLLYVSCTIERV